MTWPGAMLYLSCLAFMFAYLATGNRIIGGLGLASLLGYMVWRFAPRKAESCAVTPSRSESHAQQNSRLS